MAIQKIKNVKGVDAGYWKIVDCNVVTGFVSLALYADKKSAKTRDNMLAGRTVFKIDFPVEVTNPIAHAYKKINESKKEQKVIEEATEEKEAVVEEIETNWFVDGVDC